MAMGSFCRLATTLGGMLLKKWLSCASGVSSSAAGLSFELKLPQWVNTASVSRVHAARGWMQAHLVWLVQQHQSNDHLAGLNATRCHLMERRQAKALPLAAATPVPEPDTNCALHAQHQKKMHNTQNVFGTCHARTKRVRTSSAPACRQR